MALNPIIKFTTLFGLLAVELAVSLTTEQGAVFTHVLAALFLATALVFVYRSFYGMRIEAPEPGVAAQPAAVKAKASKGCMVATTIRTADRDGRRMGCPGSSSSSCTTRCASRAPSRSGWSICTGRPRWSAGSSGRWARRPCAVGSAYALRREDVLSPLIRNLGSMLVKGATPLEVLRQYMAKGDSPTRGRELNIHFGDVEDRNFIGQISHLGDMVPVMAGVTLSFKMRKEPRVGLVYVGDGATSTGAFHEGINFAAVQRCPLVVIVENNGYAYSTPTSAQCAAEQLVDKAAGYGIPGTRVDGNDVLATYEATKEAVDRARQGGGTSLIEADDLPSEGSRGARQSVVCAGRRDRSLGPRERPG